MTERTRLLKESLKNSFFWDRIEQAFNEQNKGITDETLELYVYVIDAQAPKNLLAISKQYMILQEVAKNNLSGYNEIYDNVEAFLHKLLYIVEPNKMRLYADSKDEKKGFTAFCKYINLIQEDYFAKEATGAKRKLYQIFRSVSEDRNENTHEAPMNSLEKISEMIWRSLFVELWAVRQYAEELNNAKGKLSAEVYEEVIIKYRKQQIKEYEEIQNKGFKYIQIEYENMQDPEKDSDDVGFEVVKGTADTLLRSINFEETPCIKLVADAGMGKTKMLEYINYMLMRDIEINSSKVFPIFINCNDTNGDLKNYLFEDTVLGKIKDFLEQHNYDYIPEVGVLEYLRRHYKIMFLIDGLNEINKSNTDKSKFIKSLVEHVRKDTNRCYYYLMTERYSRGAITVKSNVVYYKLSEISDEIKKEFFLAKGADMLFRRLQLIAEQYDEETQKEFNKLLRRPFYLSVFCELSDSLNNVDNAKLPTTKKDLMDFFVKALIARESLKGEVAANYMYIRLFLLKLAELFSAERRIILIDVLRGFSEVTKEYGLNSQEYSSNHIVELFEQLGFISCSDDAWVYVDDIYADYMDELLIESL